MMSSRVITSKKPLAWLTMHAQSTYRGESWCIE